MPFSPQADGRLATQGVPEPDYRSQPLSVRHRDSNEDFLSLQLKDENSKLRRKLTEVQSFSETQTEMYVSS